MATKQNDAVAMTDEQLDGVSGGPHYKDWTSSRHNVMQRSNSTMDTGRRASFVSISPVPNPTAFVSISPIPTPIP